MKSLNNINRKKSIISFFRFSELKSFIQSFSIRYEVNNNDVTIIWKIFGSLKDSRISLERKSADKDYAHSWEKIPCLIDNLSMVGNSNIYFYDFGLEKGKYLYRIEKINDKNKVSYYELNSEILINNVSIKELKYSKKKENFSTYYYPCTFDSSIIIKFILPSPTCVILYLVNDFTKDFNIITNKFLKAGVHKYNSKIFNKDLSTGNYYYILKAYGLSEVKLMDYDIIRSELIQNRISDHFVFDQSEFNAELKLA